MSRRRFGDADNTYQGFISAIDDHKRRRQQQRAAAAAAAAAAAQLQAEQLQQQQLTDPSPASDTSVNYQGSTALGAYPFSSLLHEETGGSSGINVSSPHLRAHELNTELPIGASEKEFLLAHDSFSLRRPSLAIGASMSGNVHVPMHLPSSYADTAGDPDDPKLPADAAANQHVWLTRRNMDLVVQKKSIWIFINGMFGVMLMCAILEVCWDPAWQSTRYDVDMSVPADFYSDLDWVNSRLAVHPHSMPHSWTWSAVAAECPSPVRSAVMEVLKLVLLVSTLVLCWQILDRKRLQVNIKFREQRRKLRAKGYNQERDRLYMSSLSTSSNVSTLGLLSLAPSQFRLDLWVSVLVCLIQPVPFTHQLTHGWIDDKIGMLMWLRIFLGFRVIRDCSEIWLNRRSIKHQASFQTKVPDFDVWLSTKTISYRSPLFFASVFYFLCILIFGHSLYLAERERLPTFFTILTSLFCSFQIVSVGWPADVWEIYMPITILGKMVSMFAAMAGLILISFVIVTVGAALLPSKFEENALNFIAMEKVRQKERDGSAALIQYVWRNQQREAELELKLQPKNPALYEEISEQEEKAFMEGFIQKSKELRTIRRERAELEERSDPTSERNISPIDLYLDTKLEAIRTDIIHQNAKNNQNYMSVIATLNQLMHKTSQKEKQKQGSATMPPSMAAAATAATAGSTSASKKQRKKAAEYAASGTGADRRSDASGPTYGLPTIRSESSISQLEDDAYRAALADSIQRGSERADKVSYEEYSDFASQSPAVSPQAQSRPAVRRDSQDEPRSDRERDERDEHSDEGQAPPGERR